MGDEKKIPIGGVLQGLGLAAIRISGIPDRPGVASSIFRALGKEGINVELISHAVDHEDFSHLTFCIGKERVEETLTLLEGYQKQVGFRHMRALRKVALISVFGPHFRERHGIAGAFFYSLAEANINILAISTSVSTCTCLISEEDMERALGALKKVFQFPGDEPG